MMVQYTIPSENDVQYRSSIYIKILAIIYYNDFMQTVYRDQPYQDKRMTIIMVCKHTYSSVMSQTFCL